MERETARLESEIESLRAAVTALEARLAAMEAGAGAGGPFAALPPSAPGDPGGAALAPLNVVVGLRLVEHGSSSATLYQDFRRVYVHVGSSSSSSSSSYSSAVMRFVPEEV